ncbi:MAG: Bax inhibitor-1/YccA family protein [Actinobacteria bacterium]|nr:Bax inhibitor-1/YccA family protein [Actinomycetota bacterium]
MNSSNPVLTRAYNERRGYAAMDRVPSSTENLEAMYEAPAASSLRTGRMTMDDVVARTGILFGTALVVGAAAWYFNLQGLFIVGLIGGLVTGLIGAFSKKVRPALYITYAVCQGLVLGIISKVYELFYNGIVQQAIVATIAAFVGMLFMYRSGRLRATPKFTRTLIGATIGYFILALGSFIGSFFGLGGGMGLYGLSGFGPLLAIAGVALASFFLVLDFDQVEQGVRAGVPLEESWRAGFGLLMTVVWLYLEVLRLLAILRGNND